MKGKRHTPEQVIHKLRDGGPLLPTHKFLSRLLRSLLVAGTLVLGSLGIGIVGYHVTEDLPWIDALVNAAVILTGMGPATPQ